MHSGKSKLNVCTLTKPARLQTYVTSPQVLPGIIIGLLFFVAAIVFVIWVSPRPLRPKGSLQEARTIWNPRVINYLPNSQSRLIKPSQKLLDGSVYSCNVQSRKCTVKGGEGREDCPCAHGSVGKTSKSYRQHLLLQLLTLCCRNVAWWDRRTRVHDMPQEG